MESKTCRKCGETKPADQFTITDKRRGYRKARCKACENARVRAYYASNEGYRIKCKVRSKAHAKANPRSSERRRRYQIKSMYGLTESQYDQMFEAQSKRCGLCGSEDSGRISGKWLNGYFPIDHDHATGRIRGLLCHKCNVRIGAYEGLMSEVGVDKLMAYLHPESRAFDNAARTLLQNADAAERINRMFAAGSWSYE